MTRPTVPAAPLTLAEFTARLNELTTAHEQAGAKDEADVTEAWTQADQLRRDASAIQAELEAAYEAATVPAVSAEAQAVLDAAPRVGARIRVTSEHPSGARMVLEDRVVPLEPGDVCDFRLETGGPVFLPDPDEWVTVISELEPVPSPVLPPIPEPGPYYDNHGQVVEIDEDGHVHWAVSGSVLTHATAVERYGPFTRLRPVSEVVDRADAQELAAKARDWAVYLCNHEHINHQETAEADFEACNQDECPDRRALLARVDAPGATA